MAHSKQKLISFAVPSYNSAAYLDRCISSLLVAKDACEIIIVNDGSKDDTLKIARSYEQQYPGTVVVIDKENGGHGSGVNAGLAKASGLFYKVVDSDDWVDEKALNALLETIQKHEAEQMNIDLYVMNFTYAHEREEHFIRDYSKQFPAYKVLNWTDVNKFDISLTLLMHSLVHRTSKLRESGVKLPEHTFYVDNLFVYQPLPYMEKIYYMPISVYQYYIGREDQSVTLANISKKYAQQIRVMNHMLDAYQYTEILKMPKGLKRYMKHHMTDMMIITQMFTVSADSPERRRDLKTLWQTLKRNDKKMYRYLKYRSYNVVVSFLPYKLKSKLMMYGYLKLRKKLKLG